MNKLYEFLILFTTITYVMQVIVLIVELLLPKDCRDVIHTKKDVVILLIPLYSTFKLIKYALSRMIKNVKEL